MSVEVRDIDVEVQALDTVDLETHVTVRDIVDIHHVGHAQRARPRAGSARPTDSTRSRLRRWEDERWAAPLSLNVPGELRGFFSFVMLRRGLVEPELTIDESFTCAEDWDHWLRCSRLAPIGRVSRLCVT